MFPVTRSANKLPYVNAFEGPTVIKPFVSLLRGSALRMYSQKNPDLTVCVPQTFETVSLKLGMYLVA